MRVLLIEIHHTKRCVKGPNPNICRPLSANRVLTRLGQNRAAEPIAITGIHTRRGDLDPGTQIHPERMPCEEGGRNWSECQRMPKIANSNQKLAERHGAGSPSGTNPANTLILDFLACRLESVSVVLLHLVCGTLLPALEN